MRPLAKNTDLTSQLGRIVILAEASGFTLPPPPNSYKSYKSRSVTRYVLVVEVIAFPYLFDEAFGLRSQLEQALNRPINCTCSDSKSLSDIIADGLTKCNYILLFLRKLSTLLNISGTYEKRT